MSGVSGCAQGGSASRQAGLGLQVGKGHSLISPDGQVLVATPLFQLRQVNGMISQDGVGDSNGVGVRVGIGTKGNSFNFLKYIVPPTFLSDDVLFNSLAFEV